MICAMPVAQIERFRVALADRTGLRFDGARLEFLSEVLQRRLTKLNVNADIYLWRLENAPPLNEWADLAREVTVGETYFFRNYEQFNALREVVLPERVCVRRENVLRFLSAGCSTGEEAYSIAIIAREVIGDACRFEIIAADLNPAALHGAERARYSAWALRETPADVRARCFRREGKELVLDESIRGTVNFEAANLADARCRKQPFIAHFAPQYRADAGPAGKHHTHK